MKALVKSLKEWKEIARYQLCGYENRSMDESSLIDVCVKNGLFYIRKPEE